MNRRLAARQGFTLIELLIVVAIIGILSTIGVPTFKRMVQKAKKSEAKVALGGLYTAENAFFSEYGGYGNNLPQIGFELEGAATSRIYGVGFPTGDCATGTTYAPDKTTSQVGKAIENVFPAYYSVALKSAELGLATKCYVGGVPATGANFKASATGIIAPAVAVASDTSTSDIWVINHERRLVNCRDGVDGGTGDNAICDGVSGGS